MPSPLLLGRRTALSALAGLAACQATPVPGTAPGTAAAPAPTQPHLAADGTGYIAIQAQITDVTRDFFTSNVTKLLDLNATRIYLPISSPGGSIPAARAMIEHMNRVHADRGIPFVTHNTGLVASAACYLFLAGQQRLSIPRGNFVFHAATAVAVGAFTSEALQAATTSLNDDEAYFRRMLKARTHLTEAETGSFLHRTVILNAEEARRDGITDGTAELTVPPGVIAAIIRPAPNPAPRRASPQPAGTG